MPHAFGKRRATSRDVVRRLILALPVMLLAGADAAHACTCTPETPEASFADADVIFRGIAVSKGEPDGRNYVRYAFEVQQAWKGVEAERIDVEGEGPINCGSIFYVGRSTFVFASREFDGKLHATICDGIGFLHASPEELERLMPGFTRWGGP